MRTRSAVSLLLAGLLLAAAGCSSDSTTKESDDTDGTASGQASQQASGEAEAAPKPDLAGIPDVVATVDGQDIERAEFVDAYKAQFQQALAQTKQTPSDEQQDQLKKQTLDSMVGSELLRQEAERQDISASDAKVDQTLEQLAQQNGMPSAKAFLKVLKQQGMGADDVRDQVRDQVMIQEVISAEGGDTAPTQAEKKKLYEQMVAQQKQAGTKNSQIPGFKQVEPQIEQQLAQQKEAAAAQKLVGKLRQRADVTINL